MFETVRKGADGRKRTKSRGETSERRVAATGVIDRFAAHGQTTTSIVQSAPVATRGLALEQDPDTSRG
jgi:hypothetical protein